MSSELEKFQHHLSTTLHNEKVSAEAFVAITLDQDRWLIDLMQLREASVPPKISKNAGAPNWVVGIANFQSDVWTILDMRVLLKNEATVNPAWGWVTLLRPQNDHHVALLWSEIVEIAPKEEYHRHPNALPEQWCKQHWIDKKGVMWKELDVNQIIGESGLISVWRRHLDDGAHGLPSPRSSALHQAVLSQTGGHS